MFNSWIFGWFRFVFYYAPYERKYAPYETKYATKVKKYATNIKKYARKIEPTHSTTENISFIKPLKVPTTREKINIPANKKSIQFKEIFPSRISMIDSTSY